MKKIILTLMFTGSLVISSAGFAEELANGGFRVSVVTGKEGVRAEVMDLRINRQVASGPCLYQAVKDRATCRLENALVAMEKDRLVIRGRLAGLDLEHSLSLPADRPILEERVVLRNGTAEIIALKDFAAGLTLPVADATGQVLPEVREDQFLAVPFLRRAEDPAGLRHELSMTEIVTRRAAATPGDATTEDDEKKRQHILRMRLSCPSEGWAWVRGDEVLGIFRFCQEHLQFSILSPQRTADGIVLRFGGAAGGELADLTRITPGQIVDLGVTRYQSLRGGHREACYAFREMLDENACRFPATFNPPVHWEQLYDMVGAWKDRPRLYTKVRLEGEAKKAKAYSCEALYLDPGWDTSFGTFLWGEPWLGPRNAFIEEMQSKYGLKVSLHCPLATWMSRPDSWGKESYESFPVEARVKPDGSLICLGSRAYLDTAAQRLLANCADGVAFLMFDGNQFQPCDNPDHGHPIPYFKEDHIRANLELARRVHAKYPNVLIEMHDMIAGPSPYRMTPIYFKYGLPGSYDMNWGFELMWDGIKDIRGGRTDALYYANLGSNVPIYTHVTLVNDNEQCIVLWWYASTCRHLGIGGTHRNPKIVQAQQEAMRWYRTNDRFFKRGEFYGLSQEIHLHVLPAEQALVVNVFNLSDQPRTISGSVALQEIGLEPGGGALVSPEGIANVEQGRLQVEVDLPPWGAQTGKLEITTVKDE